MKIVLALMAFLFLAGCAQAPVPTILPIETVIQMTMAALPKTETPTPLPIVFHEETPTPAENLVSENFFSIPGAQCVPQDGERVNGRVIRVLDGETIEVAIDNVAYQVRYLGIDAPTILNGIERLGPQAADQNNRMVGSQVVTLMKGDLDTDEQGRLLRYVFVNGAFVNYELVRLGLASALSDDQAGDCRAVFTSAENEARTLFAGLWSPTAVPTSTPRPTLEPTSVEPTETPIRNCNCEGRDLRCKDFDTFDEANACLNYCEDEGFGDIFDLDPDEDGYACEGLPRD